MAFLSKRGMSISFIGTQQKCKACEKTVYVVDQLSADGVAYHKACFKCSHYKGTLKGVLCGKPQFEQLFKKIGCLALRAFILYCLTCGLVDLLAAF
ncbi:hypothetical protein HHK36_025455 [Tetracentron sinense]|uniref:LIM zinc-binding domain-containing protein n=1 Tax=Tetracentron sinense TaxID=13715 RepID=A0A834YIL7_TETSI|nr:hypothetical protein HHK36_025455 [Tetracentron sinense]